MTRKGKVQLQSEITTNLADNTSRDISAQDVRDVVTNITDSMIFPGSGVVADFASSEIWPVANGGTGSSSASGARTNLGLVISTNVQAYDAQLDTFAALTANQAGGLVDLATLEAPASDGQFIVATGAGVFAYESTSTARTSLGLGTVATLDTGISNTNVAKFNANVVDNDFLRVDGTAIEGRSSSEVLTDIAASPVAGSSSIVTVGTITTGTWQGTAIAAAYIADAFLKNDASDTTTGTITAGGFTTTGTWTFDEYTSGTVGITTVQDSGTAFNDNDTSLMTAAAIDDRILDYSYTTNTGDMTGVDLTGGTGISIDSETNTTSGAYSSTITCNLEGTELISTGETGASKFLREDGDGTCSWQTVSGGGGISFDGSTANGVLTYKDSDEATVEANFTYDGTDVTLTSSSASKPILHITNTHDGTTSGELRFNKDSTGDDSDIMGLISFYGTDSSDNAHERLAYIDAIITDSAHGSEASSLRFYVAENDATLTQGLLIAGQADDNGEIDVTIGAGVASTTTIAGTLTMGSTAALTNAGLVAVANQSNITGVGTITSGTWEGTTVAVAQGGTGATSLNNLIGVAELAAIARGKIIVGDASGDPALLAAGDEDQVLTIDSSGDAVWADASGGGSGDITAVVAGTLLDGGATSGSATLNVDLTEAAEAVIANGDYILFLDGGATGTHAKEAVHDLATLFAGTGLTATNSVIAVDTLNQNTTGTAAIATTVTITDNENTNEDNAIVFTAGGDVDGGNLGLESDGDLIYNPSTGTVTATIFKGNIDAVDGDFDGTLEADAITLGGTALGSLYSPIAGSSSILTVGTIGTGVWQGTAIAGGYIANDAIDSQHYADGSIDNAHLADDAVDSDELAAGAVDTAHIGDDQVTYAKIQNVSATNKILGRDSASAGVIEEISPASLLTMLGVETSATADQTAGEILTLLEDGIDSVHYKDGSIDNAHIADDAIDSEHYADGSIDNAHIADDAIDSEHYAAGSIDTAHIADNQVTLGKMAGITRGSIIIGDASGDPAALGIGSNTYVLTSDGTDIAWAAAGGGSGDITAVVAGTLLDGGATSGSATLNVDLTEAAEAAIANGDYILFLDGGATGTHAKEAVHDLATLFAGTGLTATNSVIAVDAAQTQITSVGTIGTGVWQGTKIASGYIADDAIDSQHYTDGSIDNAHIADDAIDSEHYADGSIDNAHIADDAIDSEHYADGSIDTAHIGNLQVTTGKIAADAIDGTKLADNAVDSEHYTDGSIDNAHIADDAIDSEHYADGSIDTAHIADDAITDAKLAHAITAVTSLTAPLIEGTTSVQTPLIEYTDGDDAIAIADGGAVTFAKSINQAPNTATDGGAVDIDCSTSNYHEILMNANATSVVFTNATAGQRIVVRFKQHSSHIDLDSNDGWNTVTVNGSSATVTWPGGTIPTLTETNNAIDVYGFIFQNTVTNVHAFIIGQALA